MLASIDTLREDAPWLTEVIGEIPGRRIITIVKGPDWDKEIIVTERSIVGDTVRFRQLAPHVAEDDRTNFQVVSRQLVDTFNNMYQLVASGYRYESPYWHLQSHQTTVCHVSIGDACSATVVQGGTLQSILAICDMCRWMDQWNQGQYIAEIEREPQHVLGSTTLASHATLVDVALSVFDGACEVVAFEGQPPSVVGQSSEEGAEEERS